MNKPARSKSRTDRAIKNWRQQITEQQTSDQSPGEFCRERNLCSTSFYAWRKRLGMKIAVPKSAMIPAVKERRSLAASKPMPGAGFLRLDPAMGHNEPVCGQSPRVLWIDTPGGYRVAVNGSAGLAEVFGLLKAL